VVHTINIVVFTIVFDYESNRTTLSYAYCVDIDCISYTDIDIAHHLHALCYFECVLVTGIIDREFVTSAKKSRILTNFPKLKKFVKIRKKSLNARV